MSPQEIAAASARDWYSINQKYRTRDRLEVHIRQAIAKALVTALQDAQKVTKESVDASRIRC